MTGTSTDSFAVGIRVRFFAAFSAMLLLAAPFLLSVQTACASTTGEKGASGSFSGGVPHSARCAKLMWQGYTWDLIGYNSGGSRRGVSGPADTATLLLDKSSYSGEFKTEFDAEKPYSSAYAGSDLLRRMGAFARSLGDQPAIVSRDLAGGSSDSVAKKGYDGDSVKGKALKSQEVWPLSVTESSQLKASVRSYEDSWWLRTPGRSARLAAYVSADGSINVYGRSVFDDKEGVFLNYSIRPALYLSLREVALINPGIGAAIASGTANIGAYDQTTRVEDGEGRIWDVVGVNGRVSRGLHAPKGYAVLLLSNTSKRKFSFSGQGYAKTIYGRFDVSDPRINNYSSSALRKAMASAYHSIKKLPGFKGMILPRTLRGQAKTGNRDSVVSGPTVKSQKLWPLSVSEAGKLTNQQRIFGDDWWVRSPGTSPDEGADIYNSGYVPAYGSIVVNLNALRPAFYLKLSSPLFKQLPDDWQSSF